MAPVCTSNKRQINVIVVDDPDLDIWCPKCLSGYGSANFRISEYKYSEKNPFRTNLVRIAGFPDMRGPDKRGSTVFVSAYPSWYAIFDLTDIGFQKPYLWQPWHTNFALHPHKLYMVTLSMTSAFDGCEAWASVTISLWVMNLNRNSRYWRFIFGRRLFDGLCKT